MKELVGIPPEASVGFATGGQAANTVGLAAGRLSVLADHGWDVGSDGLHGAPAVRVIASEERHATIDRTLRLLGLGERSLVSMSATANGAMDAAALAEVLGALPSGPTIACAQAGNVNTGACDDLRARSASWREPPASGCTLMTRIRPVSRVRTGSVGMPFDGVALGWHGSPGSPVFSHAVMSLMLVLSTQPVGGVGSIAASASSCDHAWE